MSPQTEIILDNSALCTSILAYLLLKITNLTQDYLGLICSFDQSQEVSAMLFKICITGLHFARPFVP